MADDFSFPVDLTSIMLFASSLGEENPIYYDEVHAEGTPLGHVTAPPTFAIAAAHWNPAYPLRGVRRIPALEKPPEPAPRHSGQGGSAQGGSGQGGSGALARGLHGEQRFEYHQPLRPGMRLQVSTRPGKKWEKQGKRGGSMQFSETITEYRDEAGDLVVTATSVGIVTSQAVEG